VPSINLAQRLLIALGVDPAVVLLGHKQERTRSNTKRGPGRLHRQGKYTPERNNTEV
jgi:hypothetical protein